MKIFSSLSFRLAVTYVLLFELSLCALIALNYWIAVDRPLAAIEAEVHAEADEYADIYIVDGQSALIAELRKREQRDGRRKAYHALLRADGTIIDTNLPHVPQRAAPGLTRIEADIYIDGDEEDHLALAFDRTFRTGVRLIVGRDIEEIGQHEELLRAAVPWTLGISVFLGVVGGVVMSFAIGQRIDEVSSTARTVIAGDLSGRVPLRGTSDDFDRLGETFNLMLDRIALAMEAVKRVSDHVAHELRTPLARAQVLLERSRRLLAAGDQEGAAMLLDGLAVEGERLQSIFDALLRISRIETGAHPLRVTRPDIAKLIADAVDLYSPVAEQKGIRIEVQVEDVDIAGDADLLAQGICNLIDNAIKYSPEGGDIAIDLATADDGAAVLAITDSGPGFDPEHANRLTERFFRGANAAHTDGFGLGLALVAAVAHAHKSTLGFVNMQPGLRLIWRFPTQTDS